MSQPQRTLVLASDANAEKIRKIVDVLAAKGIAKRDIQTRAVSVQRIDWGDRKGQYQASNMVNVTVRKVGDASAAVAAATPAGANVISGQDLRVTDREGAVNSAYAADSRQRKRARRSMPTPRVSGWLAS